jgi:diaminopimelate epimerase
VCSEILNKKCRFYSIGDSSVELKIPFTKMSGAGNDFVAIDNRTGVIVPEDQTQLARILCNRRSGIGADGLLLLNTSSQAEFEMVYLNPDGSSGAMCGNGGRCIARFAYSKGIAGKSMKFDACNHVYLATVDEDRVVLKMKNPSGEKTDLVLTVGKRVIKAHFLDTGSPHAVIFADDLELLHVDDVDMKNLGPSIRHHPVFGTEGANVNFVEVIDANTIKIRTYERGVEDETLACGTGAIASAVMANHLRAVEKPVKVMTRGGEVLCISFDREDEKAVNILLDGKSDIVYRGNIVVELDTMKILHK